MTDSKFSHIRNKFDNLRIFSKLTVREISNKMGNNSELAILSDTRASQCQSPAPGRSTSIDNCPFNELMRTSTSMTKLTSPGARKTTKRTSRNRSLRRRNTPRDRKAKKSPKAKTTKKIQSHPANSWQSKLTLGNGMVLRLPESAEPYRICFNEDAFATIESGEGNRFLLDWEPTADVLWINSILIK